MIGYIGHTDREWWEALSGQADDEVNFWRPGRRRFAALRPGEPFFFRLKSPVDEVGGFGLFAWYAELPIWRAWEVFGRANGVGSETELVDRLSAAARRPLDEMQPIGCISLFKPLFFPPDALVPLPASFNRQNVSGSRIDLTEARGAEMWGECLRRVEGAPARLPARPLDLPEGARGKAQTVIPRLGQASFRIAVAEAYGGACAVTGECSLPALEAAHVRPWSAGGSHALDNGLLLRRDLHRLFDLGYLTIQANRKVVVSPLLERDFGAGSQYLHLQGAPLRAPARPDATPSAENLAWHEERVFRRS